MKHGNIDRRLFLKASAALSAAAAAGLGVSPARSQELEGYSVIVVGAGLAGLAAAQELKSKGATVTVLEAKDRIGGRLYTDWTLGVPFEVGAGWIHGPSQDNPAKQLADAVGGEYVVTDDDNIVLYSADGELYDDAELGEVAETWEWMLEKVDSELELNDPRSLSRAIKDLMPGELDYIEAQWALSAFTEFSRGAPIEDLSATLHDDDKVFDGADVVVLNGYDELLKPLAEGLDIRLSAPVTSIGYDDTGVAVEAGGETVEADFCVCSVPLGVLKAGKIAFDPELPSDHRRKIDRLGFGSVTKIAFEFPEAFWDTDIQYFGIATEEKGRWNYWLSYRTFSDANVFLGLSVGAYAPKADQMSDAEMKADALDVLRGVWGADAVPEPTRMLATHWYTDPETLGAYAYPTPGGRKSDFDGLADPIEGVLFLCGEHTIFNYAGTTHGAYMTGLRAAELVMEKV
jgi:monoamine oxidase